MPDLLGSPAPHHHAQLGYVNRLEVKRRLEIGSRLLECVALHDRIKDTPPGHLRCTGAPKRLRSYLG